MFLWFCVCLQVNEEVEAVLKVEVKDETKAEPKDVSRFRSFGVCGGVCTLNDTLQL